MNEWKKITLKEIISTNSDSYSIKEQWNYVNYLDTGNITRNKIDNIQYIDLKEKKLPSRARRKVNYNSIIYSTVRPNQRHYGIIKSKPENFLVSTGFTVIDVDCKKANPDYIYYLLTMSDIVEKLQALAEQGVSTYPSIKASDIENLEIYLPPLLTQNKIAEILNSLDNKIELNNRINNNLEEQAEIIFLHYIINNKFNYNWDRVSLLDIAEYLNGLAMQKFPKEDNEEGLPVLKIKELRQGFCDCNSAICSQNIDSRYIIKNGDVIFSWSGTLLVDFWCGDFCGLNQHLFKVTSDKYNKWFYYSWTKYHLSKFQLLASAMATTMGHIKRSDLKNSKVFIPPKEIYNYVNNILEPIYDSIINNRIENRNLEKLRDYLINEFLNN